MEPAMRHLRFYDGKLMIEVPPTRDTPWRVAPDGRGGLRRIEQAKTFQRASVVLGLPRSIALSSPPPRTRSRPRLTPRPRAARVQVGAAAASRDDGGRGGGGDGSGGDGGSDDGGGSDSPPPPPRSITLFAGDAS